MLYNMFFICDIKKPAVLLTGFRFPEMFALRLMTHLCKMVIFLHIDRLKSLGFLF
jgi:hypothetical protein